MNSNIIRNILVTFAIAFLLLYIGDIIELPNSNKPSSSNIDKLPIQKVTFNQPVQPLPENGTTIKYFGGQGIAPLNIVTQSSDLNYFVKVADWNTKQPVLSIFVRSGQTTSVKLPLGSYELKYATGETWYGENYLFGPNTSYNKAEKRLEFTQSGNTYQGLTIELIPRVGGNLQTSKIDQRNF